LVILIGPLFHFLPETNLLFSFSVHVHHGSNHININNNINRLVIIITTTTTIINNLHHRANRQPCQIPWTRNPPTATSPLAAATNIGSQVR
jgi:hypothetical protein